jgi:hypothetical protein
MSVSEYWPDAARSLDRALQRQATQIENIKGIVIGLERAGRRDERQPRNGLRGADVLVRAAVAELLRQSNRPGLYEAVENVFERIYGGCGPRRCAMILALCSTPHCSTAGRRAASGQPVCSTASRRSPPRPRRRPRRRWPRISVRSLARFRPNNADARPVYLASVTQHAHMTAAGYEAIRTGFLAAGTVACVDAGAIAMTASPPMFAVSRNATVHMDSVPSQIGTAGSPNVVAAPTSSMFQTDNVAIRSTLKAGWIRRRPNCTAIVAGAATARGCRVSACSRAFASLVSPRADR